MELLTRSDLAFPAIALFVFTLSCRRGEREATERERSKVKFWNSAGKTSGSVTG